MFGELEKINGQGHLGWEMNDPDSPRIFVKNSKCGSSPTKIVDDRWSWIDELGEGLKIYQRKSLIFID
jgi:hypothetical protein